MKGKRLTRTPARSSGEDASGASIPTGYSTNLLTKDGQTLSLTYGTAGYGGPGVAPVAVPPSQRHTGAAVPVWASGPGSLGVLGTTTTPTCSTLGGADLEQARAKGGRADRPSFVCATRLCR
jgi:hypothetical protein